MRPGDRCEASVRIAYTGAGHRRSISRATSPSIFLRHAARGGSHTTIAWKFLALPQRAIILGALRGRRIAPRTSNPLRAEGSLRVSMI